MPTCERVPMDRSASGDASLLGLSSNISYWYECYSRPSSRARAAACVRPRTPSLP
jgi:hypothetical protein